ncbi:MAG TPA: 50S ribosomal protein L25 [Acidimicrobiales bacterium]|nr:50S ribosomal protein L25 [Acidimicrobiales bacterium]
MAEITLDAEIGRPLGSRSSRRLRRAGKVPGVLYGHGAAPLPVAVDARALRAALSGESGTNVLLSLRAGSQTYLTMARELQRHPVRGTLAHVDFQIVRRDEVVATEVPLVLVGDAPEVTRLDGVVDQQLFTLGVRAKPADIPTAVEVDVSNLTIGSAVRVGDLRLPPGVGTDVDADVTVVVALPPRVQVAAAEEAASAPSAEAEAEAGAHGAVATAAGEGAAAASDGAPQQEQAGAAGDGE